eukprot:6696345-Prymnesium_polylepis.1
MPGVNGRAARGLAGVRHTLDEFRGHISGTERDTMVLLLASALVTPLMGCEAHPSRAAPNPPHAPRTRSSNALLAALACALSPGPTKPPRLPPTSRAACSASRLSWASCLRGS